LGWIWEASRRNRREEKTGDRREVRKEEYQLEGVIAGLGLGSSLVVAFGIVIAGAGGNEKQQ